MVRIITRVSSFKIVSGDQGVKLRKYFRGQVGPYQAGGPGAAQGPPGSPGINGVKFCILAISWQQNWPFRNYNLIQKIKNFQSDFLKINLFYMHQYTMTDFRNL